MKYAFPILPVLCMLTGAACAQTAAHRLVKLDGAVFEGTVAAIDTAGKVTVMGATESLPLSGLRRIERIKPKVDPLSQPLVDGSSDPEPAVLVQLLGGGRVPARSVSLTKERLTIVWSGGAPLTVPIDAVRSVRWGKPSAAPEAAFADVLAKPDADYDRIFVRVDGKLQAVSGLIEKLDESGVTFEWESQKRTLGKDKLYGVVVAFVGKPPDRTGRVLAETADGVVFNGVLASMAAADGKPPQLKLKVTPGTEVSLPWDKVDSLTVYSPRLQYVSELKPTEAVWRPLTAFPRGPKFEVDRSIGRRTMSLGGVKYRKGLGVRPHSILSFDLDGQYAVFSAVIGVDDETAGLGDCEFSVSADGRELFRRRMTGGSDPHRLRVEVAGARRLTLTVELGENLDLADHADWADACLIKPAAR